MRFSILMWENAITPSAWDVYLVLLPPKGRTVPLGLSVR